MITLPLARHSFYVQLNQHFDSASQNWSACGKTWAASCICLPIVGGKRCSVAAGFEAALRENTAVAGLAMEQGEPGEHGVRCLGQWGRKKGKETGIVKASVREHLSIRIEEILKSRPLGTWWKKKPVPGWKSQWIFVQATMGTWGGVTSAPDQGRLAGAVPWILQRRCWLVVLWEASRL